VAGSVAAALAAVQNGASLVRVHDVKPTVDALKVWAALR
jgi:dihydropteroate synthase